MDAADDALWEHCRRWLQENREGYHLLGRLETDPRFCLFLVHQASVSRDVLVKSARPHLATDPSLLQHLVHESSVLSQLRHPGIPSVIDAGTGYLIHSGIRGPTLEESLPSGAPCADPEAPVAVLEQVVEILASAHEQRYMHRDLHPGSIRVDASGMAWVTDWGSALALDSGWDGWQRIRSVDPLLLCAGTPVFLAPEAARADEGLIGAPSDLFQLGGILYRILTGVPPFAADSVGLAIDRASANRWAPIPSLNPAAPHQLVLAAQQAMEGNPGRRGDLGTFAAALAEWRRSIRQGSAPEQLMAEAVTLLHRIRSGHAAAAELNQVQALCEAVLAVTPSHPLARQVLASTQALQRVASATSASGSGRWERFKRLLHPTPKP